MKCSSVIAKAESRLPESARANLNRLTMHVEALAEMSRDAGSIPAASTILLCCNSLSRQGLRGREERALVRKKRRHEVFPEMEEHRLAGVLLVRVIPRNGHEAHAREFRGIVSVPEQQQRRTVAFEPLLPQT